MRFYVPRPAGFPESALALLLAAGFAAGCRSSEELAESELERVAKDWCLTIRASQVLPVYPLTEDLQPGDVFVVQVPLGEQVRIYQERGFLALDQHVVRLPVETYGYFYGDGLMSSPFASGPIARPGWSPGEEFVPLPRAAFPTYNFSVQEGQGLNLAIPIQGVPVGLGLMSTARAQGSVTLSDAYTYGTDIAPLYVALKKWWADNERIGETFEHVAGDTGTPVYLRVVNRVYMIKGVSVALQNLEARGAGVDAGVAPGLELLDLSVSDPAKWKASAEAYRGVLDSLSSVGGAEAGGSFRFSQASQRSVAMQESFGRPLVVGYLGFDVPVVGRELGTPIPSFARLEGTSWETEESTADGEAVLGELRRLLGEGATSVEVSETEPGKFLLLGWFEELSE